MEILVIALVKDFENQEKITIIFFLVKLIPTVS